MSEIPKNDIPESSTKNPSAIGEDETTEAVIKSFVLEGRQSRQLKLAIDSLTHPLFNERKLGRIDVNKDGLEITVKDVYDENGLGHMLLLAKADLINFRFYKPVEGKIVSLFDVFLGIMAAKPDDPFTISHDHGSTKLSFVFGNLNPKKYEAGLMENTEGVPKFPSPISLCEAKVPYSELTRMLPIFSEDDTPQLVMVYFTDKVLIIKSDRGPLWNHAYEFDTGEVTGMAPGQEYYAEFYGPYAEIFEKADQLAPAFTLCLLNEPAEHIMFKFPLLDMGCLEFLTKSHEMY